MAANYSVTQDAKLEVIQMLLNHMNIKMKPPNGGQPPPPDGFDQMGAANEDDADGNNDDGAQSKQVDQQGWQAVHHAAKFGLIGKLEELLYHGCDINARIRGSGNTPLHVAAINDQLQVAKVLLSHGADKTITNNSHYTAHQVAVIANNMSLAEFIAGHAAGERQQTNLARFQAPQNSSLQRSSTAKMTQVPVASRQSAISTRLSNSSSAQQLAVSTELNTATTKMASNFSFAYQNNHQHNKQLSFTANRSSDSNNLIHQQALRQDQQHHDSRLQNPLTLDVIINNDCSSLGALSSGPATNTSATSHQTGQSSLLSIEPSSASSLTSNSNNNVNNIATNCQLNVQHNVSPSLSQRSCNTFNTTSSGVCCDGDNSSNNSTTRQSTGQSTGVTVISISNRPKQASCTLTKSPSLLVGQQQQTVQSTFCQQPPKQRLSNDDSLCSLPTVESNELNHHHQQQQNSTDEFFSGEVSESSSDELQSLMSERKPLFVGSLVRATNCYESGDPKHLQLRRDDLIEILHCPSELVGRDGQLPRLANKPMLFGKRQSDGQCGLFPSFCVRRARQKKLLGRSRRRRSMLEDVTNVSGQQILIAGQQQATAAAAGTGSNLSESQSTCSMLDIAANQQQYSSLANSRSELTTTAPVFNEFQVTLNKVNEGFGFVLRGARIDPATLTSGTGQTSPGKIAVDERLMAANKLASLQYFSDIEPKSIAHQMGLKRGDFLVSVNQHDVRLSSHEQVVQMIRQSGDQVCLRIARIAPLIETGTKTLARVKPEPPKRDPTTTLTRNKTQRVKSMCVAPQVQQQAQNQFDADKPLPETPQSETNSTFVGLNRSVSSNLSHFNSVNSLSSNGPFDAQSIGSISTLNSIQAPDSSSSTATLTTVATNKPKAAPKPDVMKLTQSQHQNQQQQQSAPMPISQNQVQDHSPAQMIRSYGSNLASIVADTPKPSINDIQMPPPPPPLPDFSPVKDSLKQRRASAQINQTTPALVQIDKNQLMKRRETLAVVTPTTADVTAANSGPAPICTVAAACAAAANNRLQRQQQKQQQQQQQQEKASQEEENVAIAPPAPKELVKVAKDQPSAKGQGPAREPEQVQAQNNTVPPPVPVVEAKQVADVVPVQVRNEFNNQHRQVQSATLGWRSSAQIIQQSKPSSNSTQSQTLKISSTKQRMSILDYDSQMFVEQKRPNETRHLEAAAARHQHQQFHHQQHLNQISNYQQPQYSAGRQQQEMQQRQLLLRQQQQMQQQRQIQEQIRLQQQQHRCQHGALNLHHNAHRAQAADNQVYLQQQPSQYIYASQQANNNNNNSHNNHHHHHRHHDQMADVMTTPSAQQYHHQDLRHQQHGQHNHNHRHHHHHHQQLPQHQHHHHHHNQSKFIDSFAGSSERTNPRDFYWSAA